ncbi:MAG: hypothetical protein B6229_10255 [Spirochaetaceae bacterium 4572_7]|nr:MAG: hypothetical protein B6229_10255 [Spirochaetaceae bacterium 4572_7]
MTDKIKKEINDAKISIDTLFVLLLVICGIAALLFVAYLLYKPSQSGNEVVIRDIIVSNQVSDGSENIESIEESLDKSYLKEELPIADVPESIIEEPVLEDKVDTTPIFKKAPKAALVKTPTKTTIVKKKVVPKQKLVTVKAYWIQVGSFSSSASASKSVEVLKSKGLSSRIVLKTVNGKSVYRVRIGAYESKGEADKFCDEVKKIAEYSGSYVSETTTKKYIDIN